MIPNKTPRLTKDLVIAAMMVFGGFAMSATAMAQLPSGQSSLQLAQGTQPLQSNPGSADKPSAPADSGTTGQRPQATPPQPARPDEDAQKAGAQPALPPAPAEKTGPAIPAK